MPRLWEVRFHDRQIMDLSWSPHWGSQWYNINDNEYLGLLFDPASFGHRKLQEDKEVVWKSSWVMVIIVGKELEPYDEILKTMAAIHLAPLVYEHFISPVFTPNRMAWSDAADSIGV